MARERIVKKKTVERVASIRCEKSDVPNRLRCYFGMSGADVVGPTREIDNVRSAHATTASRGASFSPVDSQANFGFATTCEIEEVTPASGARRYNIVSCREAV